VAKEPISVRGWITDVDGGENAATFHTVETESERKRMLFQQTNVWVENAPYVSGGIAETGAFLLLDVPPGNVTITFTAPGAPAAHLVLAGVPGNADVFVPAILLKKGSVSLLDPNSAKVRMAAHIDKPAQSGQFATVAGVRFAVCENTMREKGIAKDDLPLVPGSEVAGVHGNRPADDDLVAGLRSPWSDIDAINQYSDAGGVDENLIGLAAIHDFRVAGHKLDSRGVSRLPHRLHDAPEIFHRRSFFEDKSNREIERSRPAHGEVVDCPVHREFADVAARKEDRADHVRVGAEGEPGTIDRKNRAVMQRLEQFIPELRQHHLLHELMAQLAATPMGQNDLAVVRDRERAGSTEQTRVRGRFR